MPAINKSLDLHRRRVYRFEIIEQDVEEGGVLHVASVGGMRACYPDVHENVSSAS